MKKNTAKAIGTFFVIGLLVALLGALALTASAAGTTVGGETYYQIADAEDLYEFVSIVNGTHATIARDEGANAILVSDIVINADLMSKITVDADGNATVNAGATVREWTPIGTYIGTFNGNGKTVSGVYFNGGTQDYAGFFGILSGATVLDLGVVDSYIGSYSYVGGISGYADHSAVVAGCYFGANGVIKGVERVGGVIGCSGAAVTKCYNAGTVKGLRFVGGITGYQTGSMIYCYNTGTVEATDHAVGGIVGYNTGTAACCYNTGSTRGIRLVGSVAGCQYGTLTGSYYLIGSTEDLQGAVQNGEGCSSSGYAAPDTAGATTGLADFSTGEVAYLLQSAVPAEGGTAPQIWGQDLDNGKAVQASPTHTGATVHRYSRCDDVFYSNTAQATVPHSYTKGICSVCLKYEPAAGSGTAEDPYRIGNMGQLYWFAAVVNGNTDIAGIPQNKAAHGMLVADIVVNEDLMSKLTVGADGTATVKAGETVLAWTPIGSETNRYGGVFNGIKNEETGACYTISGLYFNDSTQSYVGLFGRTDLHTTAVKNVGVIDSYFAGSKYVGAVVGYAGKDVTNCYNAGVVCGSERSGGVIGLIVGSATGCYNTGTVYGGKYIAGVVGENSGEIRNCYNAGSVRGNTFVGGIASLNRGTSTVNCYNTGTVTATGNYVGGILADSSGTAAVLTDCYNTGAVSGGNYVGGIVGDASQTYLITGCHNTAEIRGAERVGGILGCGGGLEKCYNTGHIYGTKYIGGVIGYNIELVRHCYNTGNVTATEQNAGGIAGYHTGTMEHCYSVGTVVGSYHVGGVSGNNHEVITNCYYLTGCATDGNGTVQLGVGAMRKGETVADLAGGTRGYADFSTGEVAFRLQGEDTTHHWGQDIDNDKPAQALPVLGGAKVYGNIIGGCTKDSYIYACSNTEKTAVLSHSMSAPNCTAPATCQYGCGHTEGEVLPDAHSYDGGRITDEPTCTEAGVMTYTCIHNSAHFYTEELEIDPDAHNYVSGLVEIPTCMKGGTRLYTCRHNSAHNYTAPVSADPNAHSFDEGTVTTPSTCTETGVKTFVCKHNSAHTRTEDVAIDETAHRYDAGAVTTVPNCTEGGVMTYTCIYNRAHVRTEDMDPDASTHVYDSGVITSEPSCTEAGVRTYTCIHDATHVKTEAVDALGHTETVLSGKASTCTETGISEGKACTVCGVTLVACSETPPADHTYDNDCDGDCNVCGAVRTPAAHADADKNESCDTCGTEMPKKGLSGGAVAGIAGGSTAVAGLGGFSLFWFVIKKRSWKDLVRPKKEGGTQGRRAEARRPLYPSKGGRTGEKMPFDGIIRATVLEKAPPPCYNQPTNGGDGMEFYTQNGAVRPIRLSEATRKFAYDSLHKVYGLDTLKRMHVSLDDIPQYDELTKLEKYDLAIQRIAAEAPIRICEGELLSGAATLGLATQHRVPAVRGEKTVCASISHLTVDFETVLKRGINGIRQDAEHALARYGGTEKEAFARSCIRCLDAFDLWHGRYLAALRDRAAYAANYRNLLRVPHQPATTFYEAVQSLWFTFAFIRLCGNWPGIGRIDYLLGDYLKRDLAAGTLTLDGAREILAHFFIKGCEWINGEYNRQFGGSGDAQHYQNILLAGIDENGTEITNEVTYLVLDILEELGIGDFPTTVRVNGKTEEKLLRRVAEVMRYGGGILAVYNEDLVLDAMVKDGYALREARKFANDGCWEVQVPGKTFFCYVSLDGLQTLQKKTLGAYEGNVDFPDFEALYQQYRADLRETVAETVRKTCEKFLPTESTTEGWKWITRTPCTVVSLFEQGCIEKGLSYLEGGPVYNVTSPHIGGLADVVNSLYAIQKLVYEEKRVTLQQLLAILKDNWEGEEVLRQYVLHRYTYYGNDNGEVDGIAARLLSDFADICVSFNGCCGYRFPAGVSTFGRQLEWSPVRLASPHGRKMGEVLAANCSPTPGTDKEGATAIVKSYCKADLSKLATGAALDIRLLPSAVEGEDGLQALTALIRGFVALGGFFMQPDVVDASLLREAQEHPENYQTLAVRVSGWNARFVTLDKEWQDMVIAQNEHG